jgi:hypothetical protein
MTWRIVNMTYAEQLDNHLSSLLSFKYDWHWCLEAKLDPEAQGFLREAWCLQFHTWSIFSFPMCLPSASDSRQKTMCLVQCLAHSQNPTNICWVNK